MTDVVILAPGILEREKYNNEAESIFQLNFNV